MKKYQKSEIVQKIQAEHGLLEQSLEALSEAELILPGIFPEPPPGMSCKDILAHLSAWEQRMLHIISAILDGSPPPEYPATSAFNRQVYLDNKDLALAKVQSEFIASFQEVCAFVEKLTEQELAVAPVMQLVGYNTYSHYRWACTAIRRWWRSKGTWSEGKMHTG